LENEDQLENEDNMENEDHITWKMKTTQLGK